MTSNRKGIFLLTILACLTLTAPASAELTWEQSAALKEYVSNTDKFQKFGGKLLELLGKEELDDFFGNFSDQLLLMQLAQELSEANDSKAALMLGEELMMKLAVKVAPRLFKVVGVFGWVKLSMDIFKSFVLTRKLEAMNIEFYNNAREAGADPQDAFAYTRAFGNLRNQLLKRFHQEHGPIFLLMVARIN